MKTLHPEEIGGPKQSTTQQTNISPRSLGKLFVTIAIGQDTLLVTAHRRPPSSIEDRGWVKGNVALNKDPAELGKIERRKRPKKTRMYEQYATTDQQKNEHRNGYQT